jgi:hypothetical protein
MERVIMTKKQATDFLVDYLNGHGSDDERLALEEWLEKDSGLNAEAKAIRNEMNLLKGMPPDPYEEARLTAITESVMSKVRDHGNRGLALLSPAWRSYLRVAAVASFAIFVFTLIYFFTPGIFEFKESPADFLTKQTEIDEKPTTVKLYLETADPKVKIYWTLSDDFTPLSEGE